MNSLRRSFRNDEGLVSYNCSDEVAQKVLIRVIKYVREHDATCGDTVMQCDGAQIDAAPTLADIIDDYLEIEISD